MMDQLCENSRAGPFPCIPSGCLTTTATKHNLSPPSAKLKAAQRSGGRNTYAHTWCVVYI